MVQRLDNALWAEVRRHWEYDPDEPTYATAANRAAEKHGFTPPKKTAIDNRAKREGWQRRGSLTGVNAAAQRKADKLVDSTGARLPRPETKPEPKSQPQPTATPAGSAPAQGQGAPMPATVDAPPAKKVDALVDASTNAGHAEIAARHRAESEDKRAEVLARHRTEWQQVAVLRQEALSRRQHDPVDAFNRSKLAKITAEITMIQQSGERKAWGMDTPDVTDVSKMTDAQLEALIKGKV